jgi:hypothetical protein
MQRRRALAQRDAQAQRRELRRRRTAALQPDGFEHDPHAFGQALDVGDAAFDVDVEQRPAERRRREADGAPGDQPEADGGCDRGERQRPRQAAGRREESQPEANDREQRSQPQRRLCRQLEINGDAQAQRDRQPQHPSAALGIELMQDPVTCPRHAVSVV